MYSCIVYVREPKTGGAGTVCGPVFKTLAEKAYILKGILDKANAKAAKVNLDPANLAMVIGENAVAAVYNLKDYIVHTHAKDGIQVYPFDTKALYAPQYYGLEFIGLDCFCMG